MAVVLVLYLLTHLKCRTRLFLRQRFPWESVLATLPVLIHPIWFGAVTSWILNRRCLSALPALCVASYHLRRLSP
jgi:hypothetical protein